MVNSHTPSLSCWAALLASAVALPTAYDRHTPYRVQDPPDAPAGSAGTALPSERHMNFAAAPSIDSSKLRPVMPGRDWKAEWAAAGPWEAPGWTNCAVDFFDPRPLLQRGCLMDCTSYTQLPCFDSRSNLTESCASQDEITTEFAAAHDGYTSTWKGRAYPKLECTGRDREVCMVLDAWVAEPKQGRPHIVYMVVCPKTESLHPPPLLVSEGGHPPESPRDLVGALDRRQQVRCLSATSTSMARCVSNADVVYGSGMHWECRYDDIDDCRFSDMRG